MLDAFNITLEC